jgi:hypothetical protein
MPHRNTLWLALPALLPLVISTSYAVQWPVFTTKKVSCSPAGNACSMNTTVSVIDVTPVGALPNTNVVLWSYNLRCRERSNNGRLSDCQWTHGTYPGIWATTTYDCKLMGVNTWDVRRPDLCHVANPNWTWYAREFPIPDNVCSIIAPSGPSWTKTIKTIFGVLDADYVANSGHPGCAGSEPPPTPCSVELPSVVDHGVVSPTSSDTRTVVGRATCGSTPRVSLLPDTVSLAPGVTSRLTAFLAPDSQLYVTSVLTAVAATPGAHSASLVVVVEPQ